MSTGQTLDERYPEHAKQTKIHDTSDTIYRFLQWAQEKGYDFGRTVTQRVAVFEGTEDTTAVYPAGGEELRKLLAGFFGIDLALIDAEKQQMVDDMRVLNTPKGS
jgi:hypothetical protein